jgi:hypothetical protein
MRALRAEMTQDGEEKISKGSHNTGRTRRFRKLLRSCYGESAEHAPDGVIIYIKPACYGDEPRDIYEYFKTNPTFPHESPGDQFFSESQFESYRMLGAHTMEKLCTDCGGDFRCLIRDILKRHLEIEAPVWLAGSIDEAKNKLA